LFSFEGAPTRAGAQSSGKMVSCTHPLIVDVGALARLLCVGNDDAPAAAATRSGLRKPAGRRPLLHGEKESAATADTRKMEKQKGEAPPFSFPPPAPPIPPLRCPGVRPLDFAPTPASIAPRPSRSYDGTSTIDELMVCDTTVPSFNEKSLLSPSPQSFQTRAAAKPPLKEKILHT
jgi:hypothetical protein